MGKNESTSTGAKLYLVGLDDFKVEFRAGATKVKKWKAEGAPISHDGTYRANTSELLAWLHGKGQGHKKAS